MGGVPGKKGQRWTKVAVGKVKEKTELRIEGGPLARRRRPRALAFEPVPGVPINGGIIRDARGAGILSK